MMQRVRWFLLVVGIVVLLVLGLANQDPVRLNVLISEWELPLSMLLLATSGISFVLGALTTGWMLHSRKGKTEKPAAKPKEKENKQAAPDTGDKNPLV